MIFIHLHSNIVWILNTPAGMWNSSLPTEVFGLLH